MVFTSPSHTDDQPRWRVVAPFSKELPTDQHYYMVCRLAGLFDGMLDPVSYNLSQSYFFGSVTGKPPEVLIVDGVQYLDQADELDEIAVGKPNGGNGHDRQANTPQAPIADIQAALELLPNDNLHWAEWVKIGLAVHRASGGSTEGLVAWDAWSKKSAKYNAAETQERWLHFRKSPADHIGFGALVHLVRHSLNDSKWLPPSRRPRIEPQPKPMDEPQRATNSEPQEKPWPALDKAALHGLAGDVVGYIGPNTESDPVAILLQYLTAFGSAAGRHAYCQIEATKHYPNLFTCLVGTSAKARKGTSLRRALQIYDKTAWAKDCIAHGGLSTGEGLIYHVRDPVKELKTDKQTGEETPVLADAGVNDKRLLIVEEELARPLRAMGRAENTLSAVLRQAWDSTDLRSMTRNAPLRASEPHISIIAHVTTDDLAVELDNTMIANGFGNRFLFTCVKRSKLLPFGGHFDEDAIAQLARQTMEAINQQHGRMKFDPIAEKLWREQYPTLADERPGLFGAITARAEAQVLRLSLLYAMLDRTPTIGKAHLKAGLAVWRYCDASAKYIFGGKVGDTISDTIFAALKDAGQDGLTRTDIARLFSHAISSSRVDTALNKLINSKLARYHQKQTGNRGRPVTVWISVV